MRKLSLVSAFLCVCVCALLRMSLRKRCQFLIHSIWNIAKYGEWTLTTRNFYHRWRHTFAYKSNNHKNNTHTHTQTYIEQLKYLLMYRSHRHYSWNHRKFAVRLIPGTNFSGDPNKCNFHMEILRCGIPVCWEKLSTKSHTQCIFFGQKQTIKAK